MTGRPGITPRPACPRPTAGDPEGQPKRPSLPAGDPSGPDLAPRRKAERGEGRIGPFGPPPHLPRKTFAALNVAQVDGYERAESTAGGGAIDLIAAADAFIQATGAVIREGGTRAFHRPAEDIIAMPDRARFRGTARSTTTEGCMVSCRTS